MAKHKLRWLAALAMLMMSVPLVPSAHPTYAQGACRAFAETGKTVCDKFLTYWNTHGGLAQQGFPITEAAPEKNATDNKTYLTQYFERAVFEQHPEFAGTPNEVLLSLLGVFLYQQKYPAGAPGQVPSSAPDSHLFPESGKHVGGKFLAYWQSHGGLAQQGLPISEEFNEVSDTNGQTYKVQYFERAVFEQHPEFAGTPNEVLLSLLGTFRLQRVKTPPTPAATPTSAVPPTNTPVPAPPTNTPPPAAGPCDGIPPPIDMEMQPANGCGPAGTVFLFLGHGFTPGEQVGAYVTLPDQSVAGARFQFTADSDGYAGVASFSTVPGFPLGLYAISFEGVTSHHKAIGYFKIRP